MIKLGISAFYHDSAACLSVHNVILAAAEEERFTGIKHDSSFPVKAIEYVLKSNGKKITDIDEVHWYENPETKDDRVKTIFNKRPFKTFFLRRRYNKDRKVNSPEALLKKLGYTGKIIYHDHHHSHAAFSYYTSPFRDAAILIVDGIGEWETITISKGEGNNVNKLYSVDFPNSLGMLYSTITLFLGFKPNEDEYKVMSLAPYGDSSKYFEKLRQVLKSDTEDLYLYQKYFAWEYSKQSMFNKKLCQLLELPPRLPGDTLSQDHKDLAAALQKLYEQEFYKLVKKAKDLTGSENICLGGTCAYNGVANAIAYKEFKSVFTPFTPSDAGTAIGVCLTEHTKVIPFLGPEYSNFYIKAILRGYEHRLIYFKLSDDSLLRKTAEILNSQKIVAWFQERSEFGAIALGNRSILASPRDPKMKVKLSNIIKREETFNPFSSSVIESKASLFFDIKESVPCTNQNVKVKVNFLPSVTHIDGTCRVQTVSKDFNIRYYKLLEEVGRVTNIPVLLNTAFNLEDETATVSPLQAIERFLSSKIDFLVIGNFIVKKI
jgi:carbamoyltransferase